MGEENVYNTSLISSLYVFEIKSVPNTNRTSKDNSTTDTMVSFIFFIVPHIVLRSDTIYIETTFCVHSLQKLSHYPSDSCAKINMNDQYA